jgi:hypothetical protein
MHNRVISIVIVVLWLAPNLLAQTGTPSAAMDHFEQGNKKVEKGDLDEQSASLLWPSSSAPACYRVNASALIPGRTKMGFTTKQE